MSISLNHIKVALIFICEGWERARLTEGRDSLLPSCLTMNSQPWGSETALGARGYNEDKAVGARGYNELTAVGERLLVTTLGLYRFW